MRLILKIMFISASLLFMAAGDAYIEKKQVKVKGDFIRSDELGNVFLVNNNELVKYSPEGDVLKTFSNLYSGDITFVDTHDPFKLLIYYRAFGQVQFLDHTLSLISSTIDLNMIGFSLATLACASYQGAFWVYNPVNFELVRINSGLQVSDRSGNLQQVTGLTPDPNFMIERDNSLYLNDPESGIMIFDKYGTYSRTIPVKGLSSFQVFDRKIIYVTDKEINIYDTRLNEYRKTELPDVKALSISVCLSVDPQKLYALTGDKLLFYEIR